MQSLWDQILSETRALVEAEARANRGNLTLSPETAAILDALTSRVPAPAPAPGNDASPATASPAPEPAPAPVAKSVSTGDVSAIATLDELAQVVSGCQKCDLCQTRTQTVFGTGSPTADLVFVGEAPGADEDRQGVPFVGRAGQLLTDIIEKGMKRSREEVYICNVLKCRPPQNRDPNPQEVAQCEPYLLRQLELMQPKVICALGRHAAQTLLRTSESTGRLRGKWHNYHGIPFRVTYHPAYILRCHGEKLVQEKRKVWEDIQAVMRLLEGKEDPTN